eukprot:gnl/TRDRNA2_/TRDRNA2_175681_c5_seq4.p2 gnl/TRDRNA2_/TRDRNA2_175681_c5~~gnl/TRDRNA2_/TRDRNA2_175681_c5_seq4.p2  ORF type:complete len:281 (+),score=22.95 gnl/TRDRNA2_/TRDRNA2_175681_c5_seq4:124-843(+)
MYALMVTKMSYLCGDIGTTRVVACQIHCVVNQQVPVERGLLFGKIVTPQPVAREISMLFALMPFQPLKRLSFILTVWNITGELATAGLGVLGTLVHFEVSKHLGLVGTTDEIAGEVASHIVLGVLVALMPVKHGSLCGCVWAAQDVAREAATSHLTVPDMLMKLEVRSHRGYVLAPPYFAREVATLVLGVENTLVYYEGSRACCYIIAVCEVAWEVAPTVYGVLDALVLTQIEYCRCPM